MIQMGETTSYFQLCTYGATAFAFIPKLREPAKQKVKLLQQVYQNNLEDLKAETKEKSKKKDQVRRLKIALGRDPGAGSRFGQRRAPFLTEYDLYVSTENVLESLNDKLSESEGFHTKLFLPATFFAFIMLIIATILSNYKITLVCFLSFVFVTIFPALLLFGTDIMFRYKTLDMRRRLKSYSEELRNKTTKLYGELDSLAIEIEGLLAECKQSGIQLNISDHGPFETNFERRIRQNRTKFSKHYTPLPANLFGDALLNKIQVVHNKVSFLSRRLNAKFRTPPTDDWDGRVEDEEQAD